MQTIREHSTTYIVDHDPHSLILPSVPTHDLPTHLSSPGKGLVLPDLKSLGLPPSRSVASLQLNPAYQTNSTWRSSSPATFSHSVAVSPRSYVSNMLPPPSPMETDVSHMDTHTHRSTSVMSLDDAETREAAETLSGLRNMDYKRSSSAHSSNGTTLHSLIRDEDSVHSMEIVLDDDEEPLLSLITESHPWLGGTINTSINTSLFAYNSTMQYTPSFVQSLIEKNVSSVANGVGTLGRKTGVQSRVRQYFGDTPERRYARENARASNKRPRRNSEEYDGMEKGLPSPLSRQRSRDGSQISITETLSGFDDNRMSVSDGSQRSAKSQSTWKSKVMITTSGLGVALSAASLRSLKFCLSILRQATDHLTSIVRALQSLLEEYDRSIASLPPPGSSRHNLSHDQRAMSEAIAEKIKSLGADIMSIIQTVTNSVSRYSGSALPENAGALVRRQLLSIPQRWQVAEQQTQPADAADASDASDAARAGQRWIVFADQCLDMILQVNLVLSGTVESAEKWLDSMGRKRRASQSSFASSADQQKQQLQQHQLLLHQRSTGLISPPAIPEGNEKAPLDQYPIRLGTKL